MKASPGWLALIGPRSERLGPLRMSGLITALAVGGSCLLSYPLARWLIPLFVWQAMAIGLIVPLVLAPMLAYPIAWLIVRLHRSQHALHQLAGQQANHQANQDSLTQTHNRRHFMDLANKQLDRARVGDATGAVAAGEQLCVMLLDVDDFKSLNARHGHPFGDRVLQTICSASLRQLRAHDLFARYGGEEFVALLPVTHPDIAVMVVERLRKAIEALMIIAPDGTPVKVTVSIGVARLGYDSGSLEQVLKNADEAMSRAKRDGKNRTETAFEPAGREWAAPGVTPRTAPA